MVETYDLMIEDTSGIIREVLSLIPKKSWTRIRGEDGRQKDMTFVILIYEERGYPQNDIEIRR